MSENQKNLLSWIFVLLIITTSAAALFFTMPDMQGVQRVVYKDGGNGDITVPILPTTVVTTVPQTQHTDTSVQFPLNINTATKEELMSVPGIGEAYAQRIITFREDYGDFESLDDLTEIDGIGEKRLESWKSYLYCD